MNTKLFATITFFLMIIAVPTALATGGSLQEEFFVNPLISNNELTINGKELVVLDMATYLDDSYIVVGRERDGRTNFFTARFDSQGNLLWSDIISNGNYWESAERVLIRDDKVYVVGRTHELGSYAFTLVVYAVEDGYELNKTFSTDTATGTDLFFDSEGVLHAVGFGSSSLIVFNDDLTINQTISLSDTDLEFVWSGTIDSSDNIFISGRTNDDKAIVVKLNQTFQEQWDKTFTDSSDLKGTFWHLIVDTNDDVFALGSSLGDNKGFHIKLSSEGDLSSSVVVDDASKVRGFIDGNYVYISGSYKGKSAVFKYDLDGNNLWNFTLASSSTSSWGIAQNSENQVVFAKSPSDNNLFVSSIKESSNGQLYTSIQEAINDATNGSIIHIGNTVFNEDVIINKSLTINSSGNSTINGTVTVLQHPNPLNGVVANAIVYGLSYQAKEALNYEYGDGYEYFSDVYFNLAENLLSGTHSLQDLEHMRPMNDLARYLGALHRQNISTINQIFFEEKLYTWNDTLSLKGSRWTDSQGTTLINALVTNFVSQGLSALPMELVLSDGSENLTISATFSVPFYQEVNAGNFSVHSMSILAESGIIEQELYQRYEGIAPGRQSAVINDVLANVNYSSNQEVIDMISVLISFRESTQHVVNQTNDGNFTVMSLVGVTESLSMLLGSVVNGELVNETTLAKGGLFAEYMRLVEQRPRMDEVTTLLYEEEYASFSELSEKLHGIVVDLLDPQLVGELMYGYSEDELGQLGVIFFPLGQLTVGSVTADNIIVPSLASIQQVNEPAGVEEELNNVIEYYEIIASSSPFMGGGNSEQIIRLPLEGTPMGESLPSSVQEDTIRAVDFPDMMIQFSHNLEGLEGFIQESLDVIVFDFEGGQWVSCNVTISDEELVCEYDVYEMVAYWAITGEPIPEPVFTGGGRSGGSANVCAEGFERIDGQCVRVQEEQPEPTPESAPEPTPQPSSTQTELEETPSAGTVQEEEEEEQPVTSVQEEETTSDNLLTGAVVGGGFGGFGWLVALLLLALVLGGGYLYMRRR